MSKTTAKLAKRIANAEKSAIINEATQSRIWRFPYSIKAAVAVGIEKWRRFENPSFIEVIEAFGRRVATVLDSKGCLCRECGALRLSDPRTNVHSGCWYIPLED